MVWRTSPPAEAERRYIRLKMGIPNIVAFEESNHFCKIDIQANRLNFEAVRLDGTTMDTLYHGPLNEVASLAVDQIDEPVE